MIQTGFRECPGHSQWGPLVFFSKTCELECWSSNPGTFFVCIKIVLFSQFTAWVDAVIFVFSLENEASFNAVYNYYTKMSHYRNSAEIPLILVGTQGKFLTKYYFSILNIEMCTILQQLIFIYFIFNSKQIVVYGFF